MLGKTAGKTGPHPADLLALSTAKFNGAWVFTDSNNRKPWTTQKGIFLPRVGLAVRVNDKTAVNIGFARYAVPVVTGSASNGANTLAACTWCPGFNQTSNPLPFVEGRPQAYLANPFPAGSNALQLPIGKSLGPSQTWATRPTGPIRITGRKRTIA